MKNKISLIKWLIGCLFIIAFILISLGFYISKIEGSSENPEIDSSTDNFTAFRKEKESLPERSEPVTLIAVGDIMLSRGVANKMLAKGMDYPFLKTRDYLRLADITFGNLETPISAGRRVRSGEMVFRADPGSEKVLMNSGFDVLSLANNHTPNLGDKALLKTFEYLDEVGIKYAGAGKNETEARTPAIIEKNGLRFAFLAYNDTDVVPDSWEATKDSPGTAFMDIEKMKMDVQTAQTNSDFVIVSMHSGYEYKLKPNARQTGFARAAIDAGAELVIGHHPHVVQTVEKYKNKFIFYSLGNFVFDQMWSMPTRKGLVAKFYFTSDGVEKIDLMPVLINDYSQPSFDNSEITSDVLTNLDYPLDKRISVIWDDEKKSYATETSYGIFQLKQNTTHKTKRRELVDFEPEISDEHLVLENGRVRLEHNCATVWESPDYWWVDDFYVADATGDGVLNLNMSAWRSGNFGRSKPFWVEENDMSVKNHLFVMKYTQESFGSVWMSSNMSKPNAEFVLVDLDGDALEELVVIEGEYGKESCMYGKYVAVWKWSAWGFFNEWRSEKGQYKNLTVEKINEKIRVTADCVNDDEV